MLEYEEFTKEIISRLKRELGSGYEVNIYSYYQNNDVKCRSVFIRAEDTGMAESFPVDCYYELCNGMEDIVFIVKDMLRDYQGRKPRSFNFCIDEIYNWNFAKERIMFCLINHDMNTELLRTVPYLRFCDLAQVFYLLLDTEAEFSKSILINKQMMEKWSMRLADVWNVSRENTPLHLPVRFMNMDMLVSGNLSEVMNVQEKDGITIYFIMNSLEIYGASCIAYDGLLKSIADKLGSGFYILPCSVHQVALIPAVTYNRMYARRLKRLVVSANVEKLPKQDILSDNVYYYYKEKDLLQIVV